MPGKYAVQACHLAHVHAERIGMKHAGATALRILSELLDQIRQRPGLKEKKFGIFYRRSKSFLHFHEDPAGLFADLTDATGFTRYPANGPAEWTALLAAIDRELER